MRLTSGGTSLDLRPVRYQFGATSGEYYDDNWLVVAGRVTDPAGGWSFEDPALLTDEAEELTGWLRAAADGRIPVAHRNRDDEWSPRLEFLEPVLSFSVAARTAGTVTVRLTVHLEAAPPWSRDADGHRVPYDVCFDLTEDGLMTAAGEWERELLPFPGR
ncbi:hypothetical protein GCM10020229_31560 [Kitasatospora albolonga]|uniref:WapI family immunity protein n=1 Tax=Kitasatospora albolonga TaxID=68173 RepID=UPI0031F10364